MSRIGTHPKIVVALGAALVALVIGASIVLGAAVVRSGGPLRAVKIATDSAPGTTASSTPIDLMSVAMSVPSGEKGLLLITFSAVSTCNGTSSERCSARVMVDGNAASPGSAVIQTGSDPNNGIEETHSMQFAAGPLAAGQHTIKVQIWIERLAGGNNGFFIVEQRTLSVVRSRV